MSTSRARFTGRSMRTRPRNALGPANIAPRSSVSSRRALARARNWSPSGVRRTALVVRWSSRAPTLASRRWTCCDTRALGTPICWAALADTWKRHHFDALVNNAGHGAYSPFAETTEAQFDDMMSTHLKGPFFLTQRLLPLIAAGGRIVNVSSGLARFSLPGYAAYAVMKGGVERLTRYLSVKLAARLIS